MGHGYFSDSGLVRVVTACPPVELVGTSLHCSSHRKGLGKALQCATPHVFRFCGIPTREYNVDRGGRTMSVMPLKKGR